MGEYFMFDFKNGVFKLFGMKIEAVQIQNFLWGFAKLILILILTYVCIKIGNKLIDKTVNKQKKFRFALDNKKAKTMAAVLKSVLRYTIYFFAISAILTQLFGGISLTLAGIGGVAIGFGAQNLVKDIINGFFILFEDQFSVGDYITIESQSGIVESIELRVTKIRDFNGDIHVIPNGLISKITNHSRGNMSFTVDIEIAYEENTDKVIDIMKDACDDFKKEHENVVEGPTVLGIIDLNNSGVAIRVSGKAKSMTQWECERQLRAYMKGILDRRGIEIAYPVTKVINYNERKEF